MGWRQLSDCKSRDARGSTLICLNILKKLFMGPPEHHLERLLENRLESDGRRQSDGKTVRKSIWLNYESLDCNYILTTLVILPICGIYKNVLKGRHVLYLYFCRITFCGKHIFSDNILWKTCIHQLPFKRWQYTQLSTVSFDWSTDFFVACQSFLSIEAFFLG